MDYSIFLDQDMNNLFAVWRRATTRWKPYPRTPSSALVGLHGRYHGSTRTTARCPIFP